MRPTYFKVEMPLGLIKDYYNVHFSDNLRIDHGNIANPSIVYIESKSKELFNNSSKTTFFDIADKLKHIKRDYPDNYQHYLTLYACAQIYSDCLSIKGIQDEIDAMRSSNVSHFSEDGNNAQKLGLIEELNAIRKKFAGMDLWAVNADFVDIYKTFKYAILEQCKQCSMDIDIYQKRTHSSSGCMCQIAIFLIVLLNFVLFGE